MDTTLLSPVDERRGARRSKRFGDLLVELGIIRRSQIVEALKIQARQKVAAKAAGHRRMKSRVDRIDEVLVRLGFIDKDTVARVLVLQEKTDKLSDRVPAFGGDPPKNNNVGAQRLIATPTSTTPDQNPPKARRLGDYDLLKKLGQGAMGNVYLAKRVSDSHQVAIKILSPDMAEDDEYVERFKREARAAIKLSHKNIVKAYEVGFVDGYHYIAMEYVDGGDLESILDGAKDNRIRSKEVVQILKDMSHALVEASNHDFVHRDIKPANILVTSSGTYKLTDLGLAARRKDDLRVTKTGYAVGTPYYISPEQAQGIEQVDVRSDIYSLGATVYHLATGKLPFNGENSVVVMTQHIADTLVPPRQVQPRIPQSLSRLIEKMMAKRPIDRHQTAEELLKDIVLIESGGMPLLKRAMVRLQPSEGGVYSDQQSATTGHGPSRKRTMHSGRKTLHPRGGSRYPKTGMKRYQRTDSLLVTGLLLFWGALLGGLVSGLIVWSFLASKASPNGSLPNAEAPLIGK